MTPDVSGGNHYVSLSEMLLDEIRIERPKGRQYLYANKGYSGDPAQQTGKERSCVSHVKQRRQEIQQKRPPPASRRIPGWGGRPLPVQ